jgi:hypothetical protein
VRWERLTRLGTALALTADGPPENALGVLLDRITRPHRLLELLHFEAEGVLSGDTLAARRLSERLEMMAESCPELMGSRARAEAIVTQSGHGGETDDRDEGTLSFDPLVRLAAAAALTTTGTPPERLDRALDVVLGLSMLTSAANQLVQGLARGGALGAVEAFNTLRLVGHWAVAPAAPRTMSGSFGGPLGPLGPPGGGPIGGGPLGGPIDPEGLGGLVVKLVDRLRDRQHWNPEIWDTFPPWREVVGLPPVEVIDRDEIRRYGCLLALIAALKLRQEPPPPAPAVVLWSDTITGLGPAEGCAGDRIVIAGVNFGAADPDLGVLLPTPDGCQAFAVSAADWTSNAITVTLPANIASGPVGLVNIGYVRAYNDWAARMNELTRQIIEDARCARSKAPDVAYVPLFRACAPLTAANHLRAGLPVIWSFKANGADLAFVEPGQTLRLEWDLRNVDHFRITHVNGQGPQFAAAAFVDNPPGTVYDLGPFNGKHPQETSYELRADGPCGRVTAVVKVRLRKVPILGIEGIELTQAIQTFRDPSAPPNSIPLVAYKDTIIRVYVTVENLAGYGPRFIADEVAISGEVRLVGPASPVSLAPVDEGTARPAVKLKRTDASHTLNFRIPAALAVSSAYHAMIVNVWTVDEVEAPPTGVKTRPRALATAPIAWVEKRPYKLRYVRISYGSSPALSDAAAREAIIRGLDLLPTIPTDLAPARVATWHTSLDIDSDDGIYDLLDHIDDQHDCTFSEWLLPWGDDCPDDDGAVWVGILPRPGSPAGLAQGYQGVNISRNTVIVGPAQETIAHELGHTLKLNHVNPDVNCGVEPDGDGSFDTLPDGGSIRIGDGFDPFDVSVPQGYGGLYDFMTYGCKKWVSRDTWMRLFNKF